MKLLNKSILKLIKNKKIKLNKIFLNEIKYFSTNIEVSYKY